MFSDKNFYVYTKADLEYRIANFGLPIVGNEETINTLISKIEDGTLTDPGSARKHIEGLKRGGRGGLGGGAVSAKKRGRNGGPSSVRDGQQTNEQADNEQSRGASLLITGEPPIRSLVQPADSDLDVRRLQYNGVIYGYYDPKTRELHLNEALFFDGVAGEEAAE